MAWSAAIDCIYCAQPATAKCPSCGKPSVCDKHLKEYGPVHNSWNCSFAEYEDELDPEPVEAP